MKNFGLVAINKLLNILHLELRKKVNVEDEITDQDVFNMYRLSSGIGGFDKWMDDYSTEEIRVGTWIDGKPVYRKVFEVTSGSKTEVQNPLVYFPDVDTPISLTGFGYANDDRKYQIPYKNMILMYKLSTNYIEEYHASGWGSRPMTLIFDYTKISDEPDNKFQPVRPIPDTVYSRDEIPIGVWIDGRPVYRKCRYYEKISGAAGTWITIDDAPDDLDSVVRLYGSFKVKVSSIVEKFMIPLSMGNNTDTMYSIQDNMVCVDCKYASYIANGFDWVYILEYTKTTDEPTTGLG